MSNSTRNSETRSLAGRSSRITLALAAAIVVATTGVANAALPANVVACRAAIGKNATKLGKAAIRAVSSCHSARDSNAGMAGVDCNDLTAADTKLLVSKAQTKFKSAVVAKCAGVTPADALYSSCPGDCASDVPSLDGMGDVADCIICITRDQVEGLSETIHGTPSTPLAGATRACETTVGKASSKLFNAVLRDVAACEALEEAAGGESADYCTLQAFPSNRAEDALFDAENAIVEACDLASFAGLDGCADSQFGIAECTGEETLTSTQELALGVFALETLATTTTTTSTTTTTTLPPPDPQCPDVGELVLYARDSNTPCSTNAECAAPRTCDPVAAICKSPSDLDSGWTGHAHDSDLDSAVITRSRLVCPGPAPVCGMCYIAGVDPSFNVCRCSNNTRTVCDEPFAADADDCGGATCDCYFGAPIPLSSAGTPACIVNRYAEDITGTVNLDAGSSDIGARLRTQVFLGITTTQPCPICGGRCSNDTTKVCIIDSDCGAGNTCTADVPNDGVRNGICFKGTNTGLSCDVMGLNPSFPAIPGGAIGGGGYSLDCMPSPGINISGQGLALHVTQTTGTSVLNATLPCEGGQCPCLVCSAKEEEACNSNADCTGASCSNAADFACTQDSQCQNLNIGPCTPIHRCSLETNKTCTTNSDCLHFDGGSCAPSTCSTFGSTGVPPQPNGCNSGLCEALPGGDEAQCATGPDDKTCDGLVRADGTGILSCLSNSDCQANNPLNGNCTLTHRRKCFLDSIVAHGVASTEFPVGAATFCVPPTANGSINQVAGLPGPTRVVNQGASRAFCAGNHAIEYDPGTGGCP